MARKRVKKIKTAADYAVQWLQDKEKGRKRGFYIKPSSLAKGCMLYVAFELQGKPKPDFDARIGRILSVGTDSHRRLQEGLARACLSQEVFFAVEDYRIQGFCDGIMYVPEHKVDEPLACGYWALEFKTSSGSEFDKVKAAKQPKEEHVRQAQIYLWGIKVYYENTIPLKGAIIYYENRDTLDHVAYEVYPDQVVMDDLLARVKSMLDGLAEGCLPDDYLPKDHWAHSFCPYLDICEPGQKAMDWQKSQPKSLPDHVMADIIAKRILAKQGAEQMKRQKKKPGSRSLMDLAGDLDWE